TSTEPSVLSYEIDHLFSSTRPPNVDLAQLARFLVTGGIQQSATTVFAAAVNISEIGVCSRELWCSNLLGEIRHARCTNRCFAACHPGRAMLRYSPVRREHEDECRLTTARSRAARQIFDRRSQAGRGIGPAPAPDDVALA